MQRLFSMFPTGLPGVGLLCLRFAVIAPLFLVVQANPERLPGAMWASAILAFSLAIGFATPICAALCCIVEIGSLLGAGSVAQICSGACALIALALVLLGPGAYSVDARLFGRRSVVFEFRDDVTDDQQ